MSGALIGVVVAASFVLLVLAALGLYFLHIRLVGVKGEHPSTRRWWRGGHQVELGAQARFEGGPARGEDLRHNINLDTDDR